MKTIEFAQSVGMNALASPPMGDIAIMDGGLAIEMGDGAFMVVQADDAGVSHSVLISEADIARMFAHNQTLPTR